MTPSNGRYWLEKAAEIAGTYRLDDLSRDYCCEGNMWWLLGQVSKAIRVYAATLPQETVPEGWKLVPERPTDVMVAIGKETWNTFDNYTVRAYKAYMAMVAAAPTPGKGE